MHQYVTVAFSGLTLILALLAYWHTRERFRLDLFEKRWQTYESIIRICSLLVAYGGIPNQKDHPDEHAELINEVNASIRGCGYHNVKLLFGPDIEIEIKKLYGHIAWLEAYQNPYGNHEERYIRTIAVEELADRLPALFNSYMYFGDYRNFWTTAVWCNRWTKIRKAIFRPLSSKGE